MKWIVKLSLNVLLRVEKLSAVLGKETPQAGNLNSCPNSNQVVIGKWNGDSTLDLLVEIWHVLLKRP